MTKQRFSCADLRGIIHSLMGTSGQRGHLVMFIDLNSGTWARDQPDVDQAEEAMLSIAARDVDEA